MSTTTTPSMNPVQLYHTAWTRVMNGFIHEKRLAAVREWEHRFDARIVTFSDAIYHINQLVESLDDRYTFLKEPRVSMVSSTTPGGAPDAVPTNVHGENIPGVARSRMLDNQVGYVSWSSFNGDDTPLQVMRAMKAIRHAKAFVVDLRGNLGGSVWNAGMLLSLFIDEGEGWSLIKRDVDLGYCKYVFTVRKKDVEQVITYDDGHPTKRGLWERLPNIAGNKPVVLLVDETSASASEVFAATLRDHNRITIVGCKSRGKGIAQYTYELGAGYELQLTDGFALPPSGYFLGDGGQTIANGLVPDVEVTRGIFSDNQLKAAVDHLYNRPQRQTAPSQNGSGMGLVLAAGAIGLALLAGSRQARA